VPRLESRSSPFLATGPPNGLVCYAGAQFPKGYQGGAFIACHGSWNRAPLPQRGFQVVFVPLEGALPWPTRTSEVFADGLAGGAPSRAREMPDSAPWAWLWPGRVVVYLGLGARPRLESLLPQRNPSLGAPRGETLTRGAESIPGALLAGPE
jgi:hypothetical protein